MVPFTQGNHHPGSCVYHPFAFLFYTVLLHLYIFIKSVLFHFSYIYLY